MVAVRDFDIKISFKSNSLFWPRRDVEKATIPTPMPTTFLGQY